MLPLTLESRRRTGIEPARELVAPSTVLKTAEPTRTRTPPPGDYPREVSGRYATSIRWRLEPCARGGRVDHPHVALLVGEGSLRGERLLPPVRDHVLGRRPVSSTSCWLVTSSWPAVTY